MTNLMWIALGVFGGCLALIVVWMILSRRGTEDAANRLQAVLSWTPQTLDELMGALEGDGDPEERMPLATFHVAMGVLIDEGWATVQEPVRTGERYTWARARGGKRCKQEAAS